MDDADRIWMEKHFDAIDAKLYSHGRALARMEERWNMVGKLSAIIGGIVALITSIVIGIFGR